MTDAQSAQTAQDKLIEAVEAGRWWDDRGIAAAACNRAGINNANAGRIGRAVNGSLDAALALHEALLPGWDWGRTDAGMYVIQWNDAGDTFTRAFRSDATTPARAWLLAVLKAYREISK